MADEDASWVKGKDEAVKVNQRALIDKVLARYSGKFAVFRELLQNADDAAATGVQIHFETNSFIERSKTRSCNSIEEESAAVLSPSTADGADMPLPNLKDIVIAQWTFKNNGTAFRKEDWNRLMKIADGNPDEQKIGAFGVGFYSVFSVTDEPFVTSGTRQMGFYWKDGKDQLFTRREILDSTETPSPWTTFALPLRETGSLPGAPLDILRFLASSITFMVTLKDVELYLDDTRLGHISKEVETAQVVSVPKSLAPGQQQQRATIPITENAGSTINNANTGDRDRGDKEAKWCWLTPSKYSTLINVTSTSIRIRAEVIHWVYVSSEKAKPMKMALLAVSTNVDGTGAMQMERPLASPVSSAFPHSTTSSQPSSFASRRGNPVPPGVKPAPSIEKVDVKKLAAEQRKLVENCVLLSVFTAEVQVKLDGKTESELKRAMKKSAPGTVKVGLIYTGKEEFDASEKKDRDGVERSKDVGSVFLGLRADLEGNNSSRIYTGHATSQTTGISGHMNARFILTVERASIDLVDRNVSVWNTELLHIGGYLCRVAYEAELSAIASLYTAAFEKSSALSSRGATQLQSRCLHALKFFTFRPSTPWPEVSATMQSTFFSTPESFSIFSSSGVKTASEVRISSLETERFITMLPVLPKEIQYGAAEVIKSLQEKELIKQITSEDIIAEVRGRHFEEEEMIECLKWGVNLPGKRLFDANFKEQFVSAGAFRIAGNTADTKATSEGERIVALTGIQTYVDPTGLVPTDGPFPSTTLPLTFSTTKGLTPTVYPNLFGWHSFSINDWVAHLASKPPAESLGEAYDVTRSLPFAEKVILAIAKGWNDISEGGQNNIVQRLSPLRCIPTQLGLKDPKNAYLITVAVFPDIPMVHFPSTREMSGPLKVLLARLGVREYVDLQVVFDRMIKTGDWTVAQLVKYLASLKTLGETEREKLKQTKAFFKEGDPSALGTGKSARASGIRKGVRFKVGSLYEPTDAMRRLKLPILDWGDDPEWQQDSVEAKFLFSLGLQLYPTLPELLELASRPDKALRELALSYLFEKYTQYQDYQAGDIANIAFIPAVHPDGTEFLAKHSQVFSEPGCAVMNFAVVRSNVKDEAVAKLKIARHPSADLLISALVQKPPSSQDEAREIFEYLSSLLGDFKIGHREQLNLSKFIPAGPRSDGPIVVKPEECYFKKDDGETNFHSKLFTFVDFGLKANDFLTACGVRSAPTTEDVAKMLVNKPKEFYALAGAEGFKAELRQISAGFAQISEKTQRKMKDSPILLGTKVTYDKEGNKPGKRRAPTGVEDEDDMVTISEELLRPKQIIIIDDVNTYTQFRDALYGAPQEDIIESLYASLGSPRLGQIIEEEYKPEGEIQDDLDAAEIRKLVLERLPLFLHKRDLSRLRVSLEWMQSDSNFVVRKVERLTLRKTLGLGGKCIVKDSEASAGAKKETHVLTLYVGTITLDYYEVANSLCKQILDTPQVNDSLLFGTILSTDLPSLQRRGYNIDRILKQLNAEREARESARRAAPNKPGSESERSSALPDGGPVTISPPAAEKVGRWFGNLKNKIRGPLTSSANHLAEGGDGTLLGTSRKNKPFGRSSDAQPAPVSDMDNNVQQAINACRPEARPGVRPEARRPFQDRENTKIIKGALKEEYCDITRTAVNLAHVGHVAKVHIHAAKNVPNAKELLLQTKSDSINRFLSIILPLKRIYGLPDWSLHIFYDLAGPLIAFNIDGLLLLNLRYYEAWHDAQVKQKEMTEAMISWFFTLAHEIAHNLAEQHNAEHSYYMNQISSKYIPKLIYELQLAQSRIGAP